MKLSELLNVLKTAETAEEMDVRREEIAALIPAVRTMFGYDQKNSAHQYDLWMHSLHVVCNLPRRMENDMVYLAALLHDIGKPEAQFRGKREGDPDMHYYGHPEKSMEIVRDVVVPELDRQGYVIPCFDVQELLYYVKYHDDHVSVKLKHVRRHTKMASFAMFQNLMLLQLADAKAHIQIPVIADGLPGRKADFSIRKFWMGSRLMSRSCKKTPVSKGRCKNFRWAKRAANKRVRRAKTLWGKSKAFRKISETWDICDWKFYGERP